MTLISGIGNILGRSKSTVRYLYWTRRLHILPYEHRFIAGFSKCTTKNLSYLFAKLSSAIKMDWSGIATLKTAAIVSATCGYEEFHEFVSSLDQPDVRTATSVQTFDFSSLTTSIPHKLLKYKISNLVRNPFRKKGTL